MIGGYIPPHNLLVIRRIHEVKNEGNEENCPSDNKHYYTDYISIISIMAIVLIISLKQIWSQLSHSHSHSVCGFT